MTTLHQIQTWAAARGFRCDLRDWLQEVIVYAGDKVPAAKAVDVDLEPWPHGPFVRLYAETPRGNYCLIVDNHSSVEERAREKVA